MAKGHMGTELWLLLAVSVVWMIGTSHGNLVMDALSGNASITGLTATGTSSANQTILNIAGNKQPTPVKEAEIGAVQGVSNIFSVGTQTP